MIPLYPRITNLINSTTHNSTEPSLQPIYLSLYLSPNWSTLQASFGNPIEKTTNPLKATKILFYGLSKISDFPS